MALSVKKRPISLICVSSLLAASVALSACQGSSTPSESMAVDDANKVTRKTDNTDAMDGDIISNVMVGEDKVTVKEMNAEEAMIHNLSRYRWTLVSAADSSDQPLDTLMQITNQVRLSFNQYQGQNTLNYSVGCNTMSAVYRLQGSALTIDDSMSTKMSCGDLDQAENSLSQLLQGDSQLVFATDSDVSKDDTPILTQVTNDSVTLVWEGELTPQAKYNSKGEAVFWAVSADMIPCADSDAQMCLRVKPITYNNQGIKISEGEWSVFTGEIDGYQHDSMHDEVLRLQRYRLSNSDGTEVNASNASGKEYAYVLDAVIQSSVAE
ncbi:MAG: META domain-containing protein [Psychrobacter sp.]|uniref:META domain-containing protein n=1 Tax=Psychrobacter sp. AOP7-B1-24 TaxID=3457645 RepID=UPI003FB8E3D6